MHCTIKHSNDSANCMQLENKYKAALQFKALMVIIL